MAIQVLLTAHHQEHFFPATSVAKAQPCSSSTTTKQAHKQSRKKVDNREKEKKKDG